MFWPLASDRIGTVQIMLSLERTDPPSGRVEAEGEDAVEFTGWLGLLKALSDLVGRAGSPRDGPLPRPSERATTTRAS
jgi:hypothetical protein